MTVEVVENSIAREIFADEIAQIHIHRDVMRFIYWAWQPGPGGVLQRTLVVRMAMPMDGVRASRPIITAALEKHNNPRVTRLSDMNTAH